MPGGRVSATVCGESDSDSVEWKRLLQKAVSNFRKAVDGRKNCRAPNCAVEPGATSTPPHVPGAGSAVRGCSRSLQLDEDVGDVHRTPLNQVCRRDAIDTGLGLTGQFEHDARMDVLILCDRARYQRLPPSSIAPHTIDSDVITPRQHCARPTTALQVPYRSSLRDINHRARNGPAPHRGTGP